MIKGFLSTALTGRLYLARLLLLGIFIAFAVVSAFDQYELARATVRFICISCLGLDG